MDEFFKTRMGQTFFGGTVPRIAKALEDIAEALQEKKWRDLLVEMLKTQAGRRIVARHLLAAYHNAGEIEDYPASSEGLSLDDISLSDLKAQDAEFVIRIIKSRYSKEGVVFVGRELSK